MKVNRAQIKEKLNNVPKPIKNVFSCWTIQNYTNSVKLYSSSNEKLLKYQEVRLNLLIDSFLATKAGSEYKRLFDGNPYEFLNNMPVTDKHFYINNTTDFYNKNWEKMNCLEIKTSGSTGEPFRFIRSRLDLRNSNSNFLRQFHRYGYKFFDPIIFLRTYTPKNGEDFYKQDKYDNIHFLSAYHINDNTLPAYSKIIDKVGSFICAYPSSVYIYSQIAKKKNIKHKNIKVIFVSSEMLIKSWIPVIKNVFPNAHIIDHYATAEAACALNYCEICEGYHMEEDYGIIELAKTDKQNVYEIVGTGLNNLAFPMIKYNTYDYFELEGIFDSKCEYQSKIYKGKILGRSTDLLYTNGTFLPGVNFFTLFYKYANEILQFQLIQHTKDLIEVKLVISDETEKDQLLKKVKDDLILRIGQNIKLDFNIVDKIERDKKTDKIKPIISKL